MKREMPGLDESDDYLRTVSYTHLPGELRYKPLDGPEESMVVGTGFVQVNDDHVLMVTDLALNSSQTR